MANRSTRRALCALCAARAVGVIAAAGVAGAAGQGACAGPAPERETDSGSALVQVKSQVRSQARLDAEQLPFDAPAPPGTASAPVLPRMQYWNRWDPQRLASGVGGKGPEKFLLFDLDLGGLNNLRIGWEVAATIAHETGRTLVLPPPQSMYLIDYGPKYAKFPQPGHKSRIEDFLNMAQLRKGGLRVLTVKEFADEQAGDNMTEARALDFWTSTATSTARRVHGDPKENCKLSSWVVEDKFVYADLVGNTDGRLFLCSKWWRLGTVQLKKGEDVWTPSPQAMSVLHGGFVWHPDVFEMASLIVQDLGLFEYASLHARYGDFQFKSDKEPASVIIDKWFLSELGRRVMRNTTGVYVSTDDTSGTVVEAFRRNGIKANSSADYFDVPGSPIAHLTSRLGAVRIQQLRGPVEQVVCAFGRLFIGTGHSTFTGYINQMRYNADSPQTTLLFHSEPPTESTVAQVESAAAEWEARGGRDHWAEPPQDSGAQELQLLQRQPTLPGFGPRAWDARRWAAVLLAPALLWATASPKTGPMAIIGCYVVASIGMNLLNKEAATTFQATFLLVIIQMVFASVVILLMEFRKMSCTRKTDLLRWSVVPLAFAGMLATSMWALREASLSAVLILKNLLPIISFAAEKTLFNSPLSVTNSMLLSLLVTFAGTVLYGFADASVTGLGKLFVVVNCGFTLMDRLVQTYYLKLSSNFSVSVPLCMLLNNTLGVAPMLALAFVSGEMLQWRTAIAQADSDTWLWVVLSSGCGACLGYVGLRTQQLVSGTTVLVLQNLNKVLLLAASAAFLGDSLRPLSWFGCAVSIGGCCWYSALRLPAETKGTAANGK